MNRTNGELERLLIRYLSDDLSDSERLVLDEWLKESSENEAIFNEYGSIWESVSLLRGMEQFNSFEALKKINGKLKDKRPIKWWILIQRVAAIILFPLLIYSTYITFHKSNKFSSSDKVIMQKVSSRPGMVSQFTLNDGTKVWLNSGSELEFPLQFSGKKREVRLKGEAFFEVNENKEHPFQVIANNLNIEVLGTSFNVVSYEDEAISEVVLVKGKVDLISSSEGIKKNLGYLLPGQKALYDRVKKKVLKKDVDVEKYIAWRDGYLIFRDDRMDDVIKRLNRWFNVEIVLNNDELKNYTFQATFKNENLLQILNLLKLSSPITYKITERKPLSNGEFTKQKIFIMKKN